MAHEWFNCLFNSIIDKLSINDPILVTHLINRSTLINNRFLGLAATCFQCCIHEHVFCLIYKHSLWYKFTEKNIGYISYKQKN